MTSRSPDPVPCARARRIRAVLGGLVVAAVASGAGCARPQPDPALQAIRSYQQALVKDDAQAAYALLSPSLQQSLPREQFEQLWQQQRPERLEQARQLGQLLDKGSGGKPGRPLGLGARALLTLPQGTQLTVVPAGGAWRVAAPDLQQVRARTPEEALQLLLLAVEQRSYPRALAPAQRERAPGPGGRAARARRSPALDPVQGAARRRERRSRPPAVRPPLLHRSEARARRLARHRLQLDRRSGHK